MDQTNRDVEACLGHARDLLRSAKRVLQDKQLPNIAFHLALQTENVTLRGARAKKNPFFWEALG